MHLSLSRLHSDRLPAPSYFYIKTRSYENNIRQRNQGRIDQQD